MKITEQYRKSVISKAIEIIKELKSKYKLTNVNIAKNIGIHVNVMSEIKNNKRWYKIPKKSIILLADLVNNKITFDGENWRKLTPIRGLVKEIELDSKVEDIEKEKSELNFWNLIEKAISIIPQNVSIKIKIQNEKYT
jgi:hypothetical protein